VEKAIYDGRISVKSYIGHFALAGLCVLTALVAMRMPDAPGYSLEIMMIVSLLVFVGGPYLRVLASEFRVTTERVHQRTGLIARNTSEIEVRDIRNVQVEQDILQRLLNVGDVRISTGRHSGFEITFAGITDPHGVAELVRRARQRGERDD
jgi:uncharacterized membrane protein YdbT with pleckstrin-like domain